MELALQRSRERDPPGVEALVEELELLGLRAGPRMHHGVVAAYVQQGDCFGAGTSALAPYTPPLYPPPPPRPLTPSPLPRPLAPSPPTLAPSSQSEYVACLSRQ